MESQKVHRFYQDLAAHLKELEARYTFLSSSFDGLKRDLLARHQEEVTISKYNPETLFDGIGTTYPFEVEGTPIQKVGVIEKFLKKKGGFTFSPKPGVTKKADRIFYLDRIAKGTIDTTIPSTTIPIESILELQLEASNLKEVTL